MLGVVEMVVTAWNNGGHNASGAGYGFGVRCEDRWQFDRSWESVQIELPGRLEPVKISINKKSFWENCPELISNDIGLWLIKNRYVDKNGNPLWPKYHPPKFMLKRVCCSHFALTGRNDKWGPTSLL